MQPCKGQQIVCKSHIVLLESLVLSNSFRYVFLEWLNALVQEVDKIQWDTIFSILSAPVSLWLARSLGTLTDYCDCRRKRVDICLLSSWERALIRRGAHSLFSSSHAQGDYLWILLCLAALLRMKI
jgi:hypothetical protein